MTKDRPGFLLRVCYFTLSLLLLAATPAASADQKAEILWDTWGIPHIYAERTQDVAYGFGWAQAHSHGNLLLRLYGEARGRAAEYWGTGPDDQNLRLDRWVRTVGIPDRAHQWYLANNQDIRGYVSAFAGGINEYARQHPDEMSPAARRVLPVGPEDVFALMLRTLYFDMVVNPRFIAATTKRWAAGSTGRLETRFNFAAAAPDGASISAAASMGWAISPAKSSSAHSMLLINPHLPWGGRYLLYEAQLTSEDLNFYGAGIVGFPFLGLGFNDWLGWTHTVNAFRGFDLYELSLVGGGYLWDGTVRPLETRQEDINVRQADGTLKVESDQVQTSVQGPIVARSGNKALSLRVAGLESPFVVAQYLSMMRAKDERAFLEAIRPLQAPLFSVIYADRQGHIFYVFAGQNPARPAGGWSDWQKIAAGDTAKTLWTRTLQFDELPFVGDPSSGWVQNSNEPPWTATLPRSLKEQEFPPYLTSQTMSFRAQQSIRFFTSRTKISFTDMVAGKFSTRVEAAGHLLKELLTAADEDGRADAKSAAAALQGWDGKTDPDSRGAVLFDAWLRSFGNANEFPIEAGEDPLMAKPHIDPKAAVDALIAAYQRVISTYGRPDVAWGDVNRLIYNGINRPAAGGADPLGVLRATNFFPVGGDHQLRAGGGDSFVAAGEFGEKPAARAVLPYGNASQRNSPHQYDQLELYADGQLRDIWRERVDIEAHLERREVVP